MSSWMSVTFGDSSKKLMPTCMRMLIVEKALSIVEKALSIVENP
jgi:hypothetical protein